MSTEFSWQTEGESDWESAPPEPAPPPKGGRWRVWLAVALALLAVSVAVYRQAQRRLAQVTADTEADVLSSHNLLLMAAAGPDLELFKSLLSGRQPAWTGAQMKLAERGWLWDRSPFGAALADTAAPDLLTIDSTAAAEGMAVKLSPDLNEAVLTFDQTYEVGGEEVVWQQTAVYRRGQSRWLYAPPKPEFWGEWVTVGGAVLTLVYPARDQEIGARLAGDLDKLLAGMCHTLDGQLCPPGLYVRLKLETDPSTLADGRDLANQFSGGVQLELPAPTLVGLPVDEAGYRALLNGYAGQMLTAVIADLVDYVCCQHALFFQALADYQLSELGVRPWPVQFSDYQAIVNGQANSDTLALLWRQEEVDASAQAEAWQVYVLIELLLPGKPEPSAADLQAAMTGQQSFYSWLSQTNRLETSSVDSRSALSASLDEAWWE